MDEGGAFLGDDFGAGGFAGLEIGFAERDPAATSQDCFSAKLTLR